MRPTLMTLALILTIGAGVIVKLKHNPSSAEAARLTSSHFTSKPDFEGQVKPILQARCQPCHFQRGKVYDKLPFDKPETITRLGTKLFTRIKDEKERQVIQEFLDASHAESK